MKEPKKKDTQVILTDFYVPIEQQPQEPITEPQTPTPTPTTPTLRPTPTPEQQAQVAHIRVPTKHVSGGQGQRGAWGLFILGLLLIPFFGIGLIFIIVAVIVSLCSGKKVTSYTYTCGNCGNDVNEQSNLCPTCRCRLC